MSLTVYYHPDSALGNDEGTLIASEDDRYFKYESDMTRWQFIKIAAQIAIKIICTLGGYLFCYKCNQEAQVDFANLKKRKFIHYCKKSSLEVNDNPSLVQQPLFDLAPALEFRAVPLESKSSASDIANNQVIPLEKIYKSLIDQAKEYKHLQQGVEELIKRKRACFLDHLYEESKEIAIALEKFLNLYAEQQDCCQFIRLLSPFLEDAHLMAAFQRAIEHVKNTSSEQRTIYHKKFEEFQQSYTELFSPVEWLISIHGKVDLFNFAQEMLALGEYYSPQFQDLYKAKAKIYSECLASMHEKIEVDRELKSSIWQMFQDFVFIQDQLERNLAADLQGPTYEVYYTLGIFLKDILVEKGYTEELEAAIHSNEVGYTFIRLFFFAKTKETLEALKKLLEDKNIMRAAKNACLHEIDKQKAKNHQAKKLLKAAPTLHAFKRLSFYSEQAIFRDFIYKLVDIEPLINAKFYDLKFFNFVRQLKRSEFFKNRHLSVCDIDFYLDFSPYFDQLEVYISAIHKIVYSEA
ncbi:Uncharacterized protein NEOC65_000393 [Neochlamydia sp. AcF65]|uniref:hypothetical protein n=1 Tax=unclassified Neochlamydia TaxID=2643326 RepID=UPI00140B8F50|nr:MULTISPECIES: hypothetical protein [unclassified Neochlamydia]MBS4165337.1 Uncharacterized protein [Neochlamydia sp. AcF65]NGY95726.1 hypothetical protein [Neochlamydia sp. AcF84]